MIPIQELLSRIRWDESFGAADFVIGYYDRVCDEILRVRFREIVFPTDDHFRFTLVDEEGMAHAVPLHRVREVWRNGELIWQRHPAAQKR